MNSAFQQPFYKFPVHKTIKICYDVINIILENEFKAKAARMSLMGRCSAAFILLIFYGGWKMTLENLDLEPLSDIENW